MKIQASYGIFEIDQGWVHDEVIIKFYPRENSHHRVEITTWAGIFPIDIKMDIKKHFMVVDSNSKIIEKWFKTFCEYGVFHHEKVMHSLRGFFDLCWELSQLDKALS